MARCKLRAIQIYAARWLLWSPQQWDAGYHFLKILLPESSGELRKQEKLTLRFDCYTEW
jgi:hypothetical protein